MEGTYQKIESLLDIRRLDEAKRLVGEALGQSPADPTLLYFAAYIAWLEEDYNLGIRQCREALAGAPEDYRCNLLLLHLYEDARQFSEAEQLVIERITRNPDDAELITCYARIMLYTFNWDKARRLCEEALRLDPKSRSARTVQVLLDLVDNKLANSHQILQELVREYPESWHTMALVCAMLISKRKYAAALTLSQEMLRLDPGNQQLVDQIVELKKVTHWSALPLWPMQRFGYRAAIVIWIVAVILLRTIGESESVLVNTLVGVYLAWVIYTWVHDPVISRFIKSDTRL